MELASSVMVPAVFCFLSFATGNALGWFALVCCIPACGILLIGAGYWYSKLKSIEGDSTSLNHLLPFARTLKVPMLLGCVAVVLLCLTDLYFPLASGKMDRIGSFIFAALAVLEYTNYYLVQLQHFDHWPDFVRLITGRGFRSPHLRRDLERFVAGRNAG